MDILGYNYEVKKTDMDTDGTWGCLVFLKNEIRINSILSKEKALSTIIHEIIEAGNYHLELNLEHPKITCLEVLIFKTLTDAGVDLSPLLRGVK